MPLPTHIAALCSKSLSWIVLASYLVILLLLLFSTIYFKWSNLSQTQVMSCPSSLLNTHHGFPSPSEKSSRLSRIYKALCDLASGYLFWLHLLSHFSSLWSTLTSMLSLEYAQVLSCFTLLPRIFFPSYCHRSFLPYFSMHSKSIFWVKDFPAHVT